MKNSLMRTLVTALITGTAIFTATAPALAQGNWTWTDVSSMIAERQDRPVWAMAYASPYWYFTDGQDLWSGGHVWKTEGSVMDDITSQVRSAGLSRVDDIVSDGQTVLFLQNVAPRNNSIQIVAYNGSFTNLTSQVRSQLQSDEGLVSVHGKNGQWAIVTSKGRVLVGTTTGSFLTVVSPSQVRIEQPMGYTMSHDTPPLGQGYLYAAAAPLGNAWIIAYLQPNGGVRFLKYTYNSGSTDITNQFTGRSGIQILTSNGSAVIYAGVEFVMGLPETHVSVYDGSSVRDVTNSAANAFPGSQFFNGALFAYDGTSWMIVRGKNLVRFDGTNFESLGQTNDYFDTIAGNNSGTFLLGGAVSTAGDPNPSSPLTLKLAKAQESYAVNNTNTNTNTATGNLGGGRTYTSTFGPTITTSGDPSSYTVGNGGTFNYHVTASDPNGIDHIDLYVNTARVKTCYTDTCEYSTTYFTNGLSTRAVPVFAYAQDRSGNTTQTSQETLTVNRSGTTSNTNTNTTNLTAENGTSYWTWTDPNQTWIRRDQSMTYNVGAYDTNGLSEIVIYANGTVVRTCSFGNATGNQQCSATIYGNSYNLNTNVAINAKITDGSGQVGWTTLQTINVTDTDNSSNNADISTWGTLDPTGSTLARNANATYHVQASATRGLSTVQVYVNGNVVRTCSFSSSVGTQTCDATIYGSSYSNGSQLSLNAKATDVNGLTAWSDTKYITVQDNGSTNGNNGNANIWISSNPDVTTIGQNQNVTFTANATDPDGIRRVDVTLNGSVVRSCDLGYTSNGTVSCSTTIYGNSYSNGSSVYVNAKFTDGNGNVTWSQSRTYTITTNGSSNTNTNTNTNSNTNTWITSSPDISSIGQDQNVTFTANATDPDGIRKIEVYLNGTIVRTCDLGYTSNGTVSCGTTVYGNSYSNGSNVYVNAKITDGYGNETWTTSRTYAITSNANQNTNTNSNTNQNGTSWIWSTPDSTQVTSNDNVTFSVGANDPDGIRRIDLYLNGTVVRSCDLGYSSNGNVQCSTTIYGSNYSVGSNVYVNAKITDGSGNTMWSQSRTYTVTSSGSSNTNTNQNTAGSSWIWTDPSGTDIATNAYRTFHVGSYDADGIRRIDIYANGSVIHSCDLGYTSNGNVECAAAINGSAYSANSGVYVNAKITDGYGNIFWSDAATYNIVNTGSNPSFPTDLPGTLSVTSDHDNGFGPSDTITYTATSNDQDGTARIDLLVNGELLKSCYAATTCSVSGGPYADRTSVSYGAKVTDQQGNTLWTGYKTITKN